MIWTSPEIPQSPLVWSNSLPLPVKRQVRRFVTGYGKSSEAERKVLLQVNELSGFRKSSNRQLITISDLEMFNERLKLWNSRTLGDAERKEEPMQHAGPGERGAKRKEDAIRLAPPPWRLIHRGSNSHLHRASGRSKSCAIPSDSERRTRGPAKALANPARTAATRAKCSRSAPRCQRAATARWLQ